MMQNIISHVKDSIKKLLERLGNNENRSFNLRQLCCEILHIGRNYASQVGGNF